MITTTHSHKNLIIKDNGDDTYSVTVDFDWKGITINNEKMTAETHHEWLLTNDKNERFARMRTMKVTAIKPFQIVEEF